MTNVPTRIRLKSTSPLPEFRIWFSVPQDVETIGKLKTLIHTSIVYLKKSDFRSSHLMLELEDYELPDESPINLLRESDVILIKRRTTPGSPQKRKPEYPVQVISSPQRKKRKLSTSSGSASTSTSSDGSSSTSTDNTSSTSASSSEISGSEPTSSSIAIKPIPVKKIKQGRNYVELSFKKTQPISKPPIPPGMGKPSTHSRNKRRKIKRWMQKTQENVQNVNERQEGRSNHQTYESTMHDHLPFFPSLTDTLQQQGSNSAPSKSPDQPLHPLASFIPPSERADLPSNILVTSIDVEDGNLWKDHSVYKANVEVDELSYGTTLDWGMIDTNWNTYPKIISSTLLSKGTIVGWRAFGLNPSTLTPDVSLLHLGKLLEIGSDGIRIVVLSRGMASFGGVILGEESKEEIAMKTEDMILESWRIIDRP